MKKAKELTPQDFDLSPDDPILREPVEPSPGPRTLCGMRDCKERIFALWAWPRRFPVPVCRMHREQLLALVEQEPYKHYSPYDWNKLLRAIGKPQLFGRTG